MRGTWRIKGATYIAASATVGILSGGLLGVLGAHVPSDFRAAIGLLAASAGILVGAYELWHRPLPVLQINRETPQSWLRSGGLIWATRNGAVLGFGATTRMGFWLWYSIPIGAFLIGSPTASAVLYGMYSSVRAAWAIVLTLLGSPGRTGSGRLADWLTSRIAAARKLSASHMLAISIAMIIQATF